MRYLTLAIVTGVSLASAASHAWAQGAWPEHRLVFGVSGGVQAGDNDSTYRVTFPVYDEDGELVVNQGVKGGGLLDVGAIYRIAGSFGAGVAFTSMGSSDDARFVGSVPHPLFFDRPRPIDGSEADLDRDEKVVHLQAVWMVPLGERLSVALAGGPSFFNVNQELVRGVAFAENPPDFTTVTLESVDVTDASGWGYGFNFSADATYVVSGNLGVGLLLRYTRGSVDLDLVEGETVEVDAGGFQIAGGIRVRF